MEKRIGQLERALLARTSSDSHPIEQVHSDPRVASTASNTEIPDQSLASQGSRHSHRPREAALNLSCGPGAFPSSSLNAFLVNDQDIAYSTGPDLVTRGLISRHTLEKHFQFYHKCLNPYVYHPLTNVDTVANLLKRSCLLLAAICATAAFCAGSDDYEACLEMFINDVSAMTFSHTHSFDDVRALCIGTFWLGKESSALSALGEMNPQHLLPSQIHNKIDAKIAVRIAGELNLHRCLTKMPHTDKSCYDRTRLYLLVYICDHQMSLSHGRPPMTREIKMLKEPRTLLDSKFSTSLDLQLISQVELWSISSQVFDNFGAATDSTFISGRLSDLEYLSDAYECWRQEWTAMLETQLEAEPSLPAVLDLYFHSARLYLSSHIFRGPEQNFATPGDEPNRLYRWAHSATQSALSIVYRMTEMNEAQISSRLPFYFSTTIGFASIFLLRGPCRTLYHVDRDRAMQYLQALNRLVSSPAAISNAPHPGSNTANSLKAALDSWREAEESKDERVEENVADVFVDRDNGAVRPNAQESAFGDFDLDLPDFQSFDFSCVEWDTEH